MGGSLAGWEFGWGKGRANGVGNDEDVGVRRGFRGRFGEVADDGGVGVE